MLYCLIILAIIIVLGGLWRIVFGSYRGNNHKVGDK